MKFVPSNLFAVQPAQARQALTITTGPEVSSIIGEARRAGGWLAGWRLQRVANNMSVELAAEAIADYFVARREELGYRIALALDNAKKRAAAASIEDTAIIERELARMAAEHDDELTKSALDHAAEAAREEVRRLRELRALLERGEITESRFQREQERVSGRTDAVADRAERVVERVIQNLGERLDAALRAPPGARY